MPENQRRGPGRKPVGHRWQRCYDSELSKHGQYLIQCTSNSEPKRQRLNSGIYAHSTTNFNYFGNWGRDESLRYTGLFLVQEDQAGAEIGKLRVANDDSWIEILEMCLVKILELCL